MLRIWGDFNELDAKLRIILPSADDVKSERVELKEGMHAIIWDGDIEVEGVLEFEDERWRAQIVPGSGRYMHGNEHSRIGGHVSAVRLVRKVGRVEIWFSDYWDMPRVFITNWKGKLLLFDAHFDDDLDDYLDHFSVYETTPELAEQLYDIPWDSVASQGRLLGRIFVKEVKFPFRLKRWNSEEERIAALHGPVTKSFSKGWMDDGVFKKLGID